MSDLTILLLIFLAVEFVSLIVLHVGWMVYSQKLVNKAVIVTGKHTCFRQM